MIFAGTVAEDLSSAKDAVREHPGNVENRLRLFQLLCLTGSWLKAAQQAQTLVKLDPRFGVTVAMWVRLLESESARRQVVAGAAQPEMADGKVCDESTASQVRACHLAARGDVEGALVSHREAGASSRHLSATINGNEYREIGDGDMRFGRMLETFFPGGYRWVQLSQVRTLKTKPPATWLDLVWLGAELEMIDGTKSNVFLPLRYPGTEALEDPALVTGQKTRWTDLGGGFHQGAGQRVLFAGSEMDFGLAEIREMSIQHDS